MPAILKSYIENDKTNFVSTLCREGKIVYGSPVNRYVEQIADQLLINEPTLRSEITILIIKSPIVNAFANHDGILLVDIGIIAQASNEAEIAITLSHEIAHYALKHTHIVFDYTKKSDVILAKHEASREQENEADTKGIEHFYAASKYSYRAFEGFYDVLQYGYLPFDNLPFERALIENGGYVFPEAYFLQNVKPISNRDDYLDTLSTHPNIAKRRAAANAIVKNKDNTGRQLFLQSETLFNEIRSLCRLECINQWLIQHDYVNAYYNAFVLQKENPDNLFYQNAMAIALYGLSKHKTEHSYREVIKKYTEFEGEQQAAYYFFEKASKLELNPLAIRALWKIQKTQPDNIPCSNMLNDLIKDLTIFNLSLSEFSDYPMGTLLDTIQEQHKAVDQTSNDKYGRIKNNSPTVQKIKPTDNFKVFQYMLCDLKQDSSFRTYFQQIQNTVADEKILTVLLPSKALKEEMAKFFFMQPFYTHYNKNGIEDEKKSNTGLIATEKALKKSAKRLKINYNTIKFKDLAGGGRSSCELINENDITALYNNYCNLQEWIFNAFGIKEDMVPHLSLDVDQIHPGSRYLVVSGTVVRQEKLVSFFKISDIVFSAICIYAAPFTLAKFFVPVQSIAMDLSVVDITTGKTVFVDSDNLYKKHNVPALHHAFIYDCLYAIKKGGEK
jgi:hypothetical protein